MRPDPRGQLTQPSRTTLLLLANMLVSTEVGMPLSIILIKFSIFWSFSKLLVMKNMHEVTEVDLKRFEHK